MHPKQTEAPQYSSRRERHEAEAAKMIIDPALTRRESRALERANGYLAGLRRMNEAQISNHELFPDAPIFSIVDKNGNDLFEAPKPDGPKHGDTVDLTYDLDVHENIIKAYQARVDNKDWGVIGELDDKWHRAQPSEYEAQTKFAEYELNDPDRFKKIGNFVSRRVIGARQNWLNQVTARVKKRLFFGSEDEEDVYQDSAEEHYKKAA
jgi:hypothetical protein